MGKNFDFFSGNLKICFPKMRTKKLDFISAKKNLPNLFFEKKFWHLKKIGIITIFLV